MVNEQRRRKVVSPLIYGQRDFVVDWKGPLCRGLLLFSSFRPLLNAGTCKMDWPGVRRAVSNELAWLTLWLRLFTAYITQNLPPKFQTTPYWDLLDHRPTSKGRSYLRVNKDSRLEDFI